MAEKKRSRRLARLALISFLLLIAVLAVSVAVLVNQPELLGLSDTFTRRLEQETGLVCRVGGPVELGIFPKPHLQVYRIMIYTPETAGQTDAAAKPDAAGETGGQLLLNVSAARLEVEILPLLWGEVSLKKLKIYDPVLHLDALQTLWAGEPARPDAAGGEGSAAESAGQSAPEARAKEVAGPGNTAPERSASLQAPGAPEAGTATEWVEAVRLLSDMEINGGVVLDKNADGSSTVLASGLNLKPRGDGLVLSLRAHALADAQNPPSVLDLQLDDLRVSAAGLQGSFRVRSEVNLLGQSLQPELRLDLSYDFQQQSLRADNLELAVEKLRINGWAAANLGGSFVVRGRLEHSGLSLTRWFEFGRNLPGSLQYALDDLSGFMEFTLTPDYLDVSKLETTVLGRVLRGRGGCPDFSAPSVVIAARAAFLDLNDLFPEVAEPPPEVLPRVNYTVGFLVPPVAAGETAADSDLPDVGYDIAIAADESLVRKLKIADLTCRIVPSDRGTQCLFNLGETAGGALKAALTVLSGTGLIEVDAGFEKLEAGRLGQDLFQRAPLTAQASGTAKFTARPDTLDIFFRTMALECNVQFGAGALELSSAKRTLHFDTAFAAGAGSSRPGQLEREKLDTMLVFEGNWQFRAAKGAEKLSARLSGPIGVDEQSLDLVSFGGKLQADVNAELAWLGVTPKNTLKLSGQFAYDDRENSLELSKAGITLPYGTLSGNIRGRDQGRAAESWSGKVTLELPSTRAWLRSMGVDPQDLPEQGLGKGVFSFAFEQSGQAWAVKDADIRLDGGVSGKVSLAQPAPGKYTFNARLNKVDLDVYYPARTTSSAFPSPRPWDLSGLRKQNIQGSLSIEELFWRKLRYSGVSGKVNLSNGKFDIPVQGGFYQGKFTSTFTGVVEPSRLNSQFTLDFAGVQLGQITRELYNDAMVSGVFSASVRAAGAPGRATEILPSFSGQWAFVVGPGYFRSRQEAGAAEPAKTDFSAVTASGRLGGGRLETDNFTLSAPGSTDTTGHGYVDLVNDTIRLDLEVRMLGIDVPVRVSGPLDDPSTSVKSGKLIGNAVGGIGRGLFGLMVDVISLPGRVITLPFGGSGSSGGSSGGRE